MFHHHKKDKHATDGTTGISGQSSQYGTFLLRPIQANLTHDTDWLGKMDPYCSYRVGPTRVKGAVCRNGGKFPKWEDATVSLPAPSSASMVVDLLDKDKILFDDNIGSFVVDLNEIRSVGQISKWYPVYYRQKPAGEILMEAAFQPPVVQQVVVEPVIVKQTIVEQPVIVEKVIKEEIIQAPVVTTTQQQQFVSGPIIQGTSQIHHEGYGLVPQQGGIITQGTTLGQGGIIQEGSHHHHHHHHDHNQQEMTNFPDNHFTQGGWQQSKPYDQGLTQGLQQGSYTQGGLNQGGLQQGTYSQSGLTQQGLGLNQGGPNQGTYQ